MPDGSASSFASASIMSKSRSSKTTTTRADSPVENFDFNTFFRAFPLNSPIATYIAELDTTRLMADVKTAATPLASVPCYNRGEMLRVRARVAAELRQLAAAFAAVEQGGVDVRELRSEIEQASKRIDECIARDEDAAAARLMQAKRSNSWPLDGSESPRSDSSRSSSSSSSSGGSAHSSPASSVRSAPERIIISPPRSSPPRSSPPRSSPPTSAKWSASPPASPWTASPPAGSGWPSTTHGDHHHQARGDHAQQYMHAHAHAPAPPRRASAPATLYSTTYLTPHAPHAGQAPRRDAAYY